MILLIDNYDSFVHNLARYLRELLGDSGCPVDVLRNDVVTVADIERLEPQAIVISPGPCTPREAGISVPLVQQLSQRVPMLGVCLGHQTIAGAALDTFDIEPLPTGHALLKLDNALICPHLGYVTDDSYKAMYSGVVEDIRAFASGEPVRMMNEDVTSAAQFRGYI